MARVVVVGAGMGGLAAALRLSASGHDVTVCEAGEQVGGKLGRWRSEGFTFDTGPSLVTMPQVFAELFSDVGARLDDHVTLEPLDPLARSRWTDGTVLDTHADPAATAEAMASTFGRAAAGDWERLMARGRRMWRAVEDPVLRTPSRGAATFAPLVRRIGDLRTLAPTRTLRDLGWRYLRDPRQRMLLDRYATYTGSDPRRAPAALLTAPWAEAAFGGWYVRGGLYRLAQVTAGLAVERGADLRLGTAVGSIAVEAGAVRGVRTHRGDFLPADVVVADVDARTLYGAAAGVAAAGRGGLLPSDAPGVRSRRRQLARTPASLSGFVLLLGVEGDHSQRLAAHNVFFPTDYDAEFDALFGRRPAPVAEPTVYVHRPADASQAPPGAEAWFVLVNAPRHGDQVDWDAPGLVDRYADRVLAVLAAHGVDVRDRIVVRRTISPAALERATGAPGGAIYGSSSNGPAAAFLRTPNDPPVHGLYAVGGSAHPGGGLPLVTLSAASAARLIGPA